MEETANNPIIGIDVSNGKEYTVALNDKGEEEIISAIDNAETIEEVESIEKGIDNEIEKVLKEKEISDEKVFELEELNEEDKKQLSEEEIRVYDIALELKKDDENKINLLENYSDRLTEEEKILLENKNKEAETQIRARLILEGLGVAARIEENKFKKKANNIIRTTYPVAIINQYFKLNAKRFELTEENKEDKSAIERAKSYYYTLGIKKLLDMSKDEVFLSRLIKQCSDKRYKRHIEDIDFFIGKAIGQNGEARQSSVNNVKKLDENIKKVFFKHFMYDIWKLDNEFNNAISRAYGYAVSEIVKKSDIRSNDMIEIYFYNANVAVFTMMGSKDSYKDLTGDAKTCYDYVYEFVENVYNYFKSLTEK